MDDKTNNNLLTLGSIAFCFVASVYVYFASLLIACLLSTKPMIISIVLGALLLITIAACINIFKIRFKHKIISLIICALPTIPAIIIIGRFDDRSYSDGYLSIFCCQVPSRLPLYRYYDKLGREVFWGSEDEFTYFLIEKSHKSYYYF